MSHPTIAFPARSGSARAQPLKLKPQSQRVKSCFVVAFTSDAPIPGFKHPDSFILYIHVHLVSEQWTLASSSPKLSDQAHTAGPEAKLRRFLPGDIKLEHETLPLDWFNIRNPRTPHTLVFFMKETMFRLTGNLVPNTLQDT